MNKKFKVTFLLDNKNLWCEKYLRKHNFNLNKKYFFKISKNANKIKKQNIVIPLNYTKILPQSFLSINELVLIAHASKLPKDKGFAPVQNQILKNKKKIFVTLLKAVDEVDSGPIFFQNYFLLNGTELSKEIRYKQIQAMFKIIKKFLTMYPNVKSTKQLSKGNFNKRRKKKDSKINLNKSIKSQFNLLRISDNDQYPSYFNYLGQKYIIKIFNN